MAMSAAYCSKGAEVEKVLDYESHVDKDTSSGTVRTYKWKKSNPPQRGFIVDVQYFDDAYSQDTVQAVFVKFEAGKKPERVLPTQLNLVKIADEAALFALKNEIAIQKANDGLIDDIKKPLAIDRTGVGRTKSGKGLSASDAEDLATK